MKKLRVALVVAARVPVEKYGGTERQVVWLARELMRRNHAVTLVVSPGSHVAGARMIDAQTTQEAFDRIPADVDIVNSFDSEPPAEFDRPCLVTHQGNTEKPIGRNRNFVSRNHAERHGRETFAYNGLPTDEHYYQDRKNGRYLFFSRINRPGKNVTRAMQLAVANDLQMDIAGGARWELLTRSVVRKERAFFTSLDKRFAIHGMVGGWTKAKLFAEAKALLFPIRWEEPFGIVVPEALLAGTPVIATPRGSMPELLHPDIGFQCESDEDFAAAFDAVGDIPPARCREYAAENFSIEKSTDTYLDLYQRILDGETLP